MLDLNIFGDYKLKCIGEYCYINEDGDFSKGKIDYEREFNGYELIKFICDTLQLRDFCCVSFDTNKIIIEEFDPMSGEFSDYTMFITETNSHK